jgi:hypothetical protein
VCLAIFVVFKMSHFRKQRICVKFCVKLEKSFTEMFEMLKTAFGNEALGQTQMCEWWKCFKDGQTSTDDPRLGRPSDEIVAKVREVIRSNRCLTVCKVAEEVSILKTVMKCLRKI